MPNISGVLVRVGPDGEWTYYPGTTNFSVSSYPSGVNLQIRTVGEYIERTTLDIENVEAPVISISSGSGYAGSTYSSTIAGQWTANGVAIPNATGNTFVLTMQHEGAEIKCGDSNSIQMWTPNAIDPTARAAWFDMRHAVLDANDPTLTTGVTDRWNNIVATVPTASNDIPRVGTLEGQRTIYSPVDSVSRRRLMAPNIPNAATAFIIARAQDNSLPSATNILASVSNTSNDWRQLAMYSNEFGWNTQGQGSAFDYAGNSDRDHSPGILFPTKLIEWRTNIFRDFGLSMWGKAGSISSWGGHGCQVLVFTRLLTLEEKTLLSGYAAWLYGGREALPIDHPFRNMPPMIIGSNNTIAAPSTPTAPTVTTQPSITPSSGAVGTTFTFNSGEFGGTAPIKVSRRIVQNGVDVTDRFNYGNRTFRSTVAGPLDFIVTVDNGVGQPLVITTTVNVAHEEVSDYSTWNDSSVWLDMSDQTRITMSVTTPEAVATIINKRASSGGNFTGAGAESGRTLVTNAQNGLQALRITSTGINTNDRSRFENSTASLLDIIRGLNRPYTIIMAYKPTDTRSSYVWALSGQINSGIHTTGLVNGSTQSTMRRSIDRTFGNDVNWNHANSVNVPRIVAVRYDGMRVTVWDTNVSEPVANLVTQQTDVIGSNVMFSLFSDRGIQTGSEPQLGEQGNLDFYELLVQNTAKSPANITKAMRDIAVKWNIPVFGMNPDGEAIQPPTPATQPQITPSTATVGETFTITPGTFTGATPITYTRTLSVAGEVVVTRDNGDPFTYVPVTHGQMVWTERASNIVATNVSQTASATINTAITDPELSGGSLQIEETNNDLDEYSVTANESEIVIHSTDPTIS